MSSISKLGKMLNKTQQDKTIMENESKSIHEFDINLICEYFLEIERQGPGSEEATKKSLSFISNLNEKSNILDIGCGTGGQTITIAQNSLGNIFGIDLFPDFVNKLNENARKLNLQSRIKGIVGSMENLSFNNEEFDLIWSEGAIYNIGFKRGLKEWNKFIKKGGYIAVTEASWFTQQRPNEIEEFWMNAYSEIDTIPNKVLQLQESGYRPVATFIIPENCWTDNFYIPQVKAQELFLKKYKGNKTVEDLIANQKYEAQLYSKYKDYYGYVFYIGQKI
jgi:ubiquinone/menaquinone biosynthesis C-methylase UbiE